MLSGPESIWVSTCSNISAAAASTAFLRATSTSFAVGSRTGPSSAWRLASASAMPSAMPAFVVFRYRARSPFTRRMQ